MAEQHPITPPPPELVEQWYEAIDNSSTPWRQQLATKAARWGADQELEACCAWTAIVGGAEALRNHRRPKPPSLVEQALAELEVLSNYAHDLDCSESAIRRALERLQELENND